MSRFLLVFDLDGTLVDSAPDLRAVEVEHQQKVAHRYRLFVVVL